MYRGQDITIRIVCIQSYYIPKKIRLLSLLELCESFGIDNLFKAAARLNDHLLGKELSIWFTVRVFREPLSFFCVCPSFPFGFEGAMWGFIALIPDHCLSVILKPINMKIVPLESSFPYQNSVLPFKKF